MYLYLYRSSTSRGSRAYTRAATVPVTISPPDECAHTPADLIVSHNDDVQTVSQDLTQETVATTTDQHVTGAAAAVSIMHPDGTETTIPIELVGKDLSSLFLLLLLVVYDSLRQMTFLLSAS